MPERFRHPIFARVYTKFAKTSNRRGGDEHRRKLLADLSGRVIELGAGSGANFAHYPASVDEVLAVEPEPYLRQQALRAATEASVNIRVLALPRLARVTRVQGDAVGATVELRSPNLDQLSKRWVKLDQSIECHHRAIGVERRGLQIDALILHRITCYSPATRKTPGIQAIQSRPGCKQSANMAHTIRRQSPQQPRGESLAVEPIWPTEQHPATPLGTNHNPRVGGSSPSSGTVETPLVKRFSAYQRVQKGRLC